MPDPTIVDLAMQGGGIGTSLGLFYAAIKAIEWKRNGKTPDPAPLIEKIAALLKTSIEIQKDTLTITRDIHTEQQVQRVKLDVICKKGTE